MPSRTVSTLAMYSSGVWSETIGPAARLGRLRLGAPSRGRPAVETSPRVEVVLVALDLLLLAIHEPDVVAEEQMQVLVAVARQLLFDGLELEQQVVAEGADQAEARILIGRGIPRSARAEWKMPRAACCAPLRKTAPTGAVGRPTNCTRMRRKLHKSSVALQHWFQQVEENYASLVKGSNSTVRPHTDNLERRHETGNVPTRIPFRILVTG